MKTLKLDGEDIIVLVERGRGPDAVTPMQDGTERIHRKGAIVNYLVREIDGTYTSLRHWYALPADAWAEFARADSDNVRDKVLRARAIAEKGLPVEIG